MSAEAVGWVFRESPYRGAALLVHLAIADAANDLHDHELWAKHATIATKARVSRESVSRIVADMCDAGHLQLLEDNSRRGGDTTNRYRFVMQRGVTNDHTEREGGVTNDHTGCDERSHPGVTNDHTHKEPKLLTQAVTQAIPPPDGEDEPVPVRTPPVASGVPPYPMAFELIWKDYPRKVDKKAAYAAWRARVIEWGKKNAGGDCTEMMGRAVVNYARRCKIDGTEEKFIMHGATFFGPHERWMSHLADIAPRAAMSDADALDRLNRDGARRWG